MHSSKIALIVCVTALIGLFGAAVGKADAAGTTRYAGPGSSLVSGACTDQSTPCRIDYAASISNGGDRLIALPGVHIFAPSNSTYISLSGVTLESLPGAPRATIKQTVAYANACNCPTISAYGTTHIDNINIVNTTPPSAGALGMTSTVTVTNSVLEGVGGGAYTFPGAGPKGTFSGNVVRSTGPGTTGFYIGGGAPIDVSQSTIWAPNRALQVDEGSAPIAVAVHNSIIRGGVHDASLYGATSAGITVTFDHSSIDQDSISTFGGNVSVVNGPGNLAVAPSLADPATGDFHQLAASNTINAGAAPFSGVDIDGQAFGAEGAPDIGADEYVSLAAGGGGGGTDAVAATGGSGQTANPVLTGLTGQGLKLSARKKGKFTASVTCPKSASGPCTGTIAVKQGSKTKTAKVKPIAPGKTAKMKLKARKGKAAVTIALTDSVGHQGTKSVSKKFR